MARPDPGPLLDEQLDDAELICRRLQVGERLFWVRDLDTWDPTEITVTKVGRKWAAVTSDDHRWWWDRIRINAETLDVDGMKCIAVRSQEEWEARRAERDARAAAREAWKWLEWHMHYRHCPEHLTADAINGVIATLFPEHDSKEGE